MLMTARKTLTWGTFVAAVGSALLLAYPGSMPRFAGIDVATLRPAAAVRSEPASQHNANGGAARSGGEPVPGAASH